MSFFPPEPEPVAPAGPEMVDRLDPRAGNFPGYLGLSVSVDVEPLRTDRLAITMDQFTAFPEGFEARLTAIAKPGHTIDDDGMYPDRTMGPRRLRIGLEFSDGRRGFPVHDEVRGADFGIALRSGEGAHFRVRQELWVHAVPSPGQMDLVVRWLDMGLDETRLAIPTHDIVEAIARVGPVWPD